MKFEHEFKFGLHGMLWENPIQLRRTVGKRFFLSCLSE